MPKLRAARLEDYEGIVRLGLAHSLDVPAYEDWSALWLDNPLRQRSSNDFPIGWVLELPDGELVGTIGSVRAPYTFRGDALVSAVSRAWFVTLPYRGFALQLIDEYLNQPDVDLFINNAVSVRALETFSQFCERVPLGEWDSVSYWVIGSHSDAAELSKDTVWIDSIPKTVGSHSIEITERFDSRFDLFWDELARENREKLIALRNAETLSWHFAAPMRRGRSWVFTASRSGKLRAYCALTRQDYPFRLPALPHGDTRRLPGMRLVDYQCIDSELDFLPAFLQTALQRCAAEHVVVLENLGHGVPKMRVFDECAPYRKKLENWKFFYSAAEPTLNAELRESRYWDPSAYDGDVSFE
jgi:hypothetical protein